MYDKTDRAPKAGSLKEALFVNVWLKRQEQRVAEMRVLAQGMANREHLGKAFQEFINTIYPFAKDLTKDSDKKMMEQFEKVAAMGPITFTVMDQNILRDAAKKYTMSDEDIQKLRKSSEKRKGLR